jgi:hypothetical protein
MSSEDMLSKYLTNDDLGSHSLNRAWHSLAPVFKKKSDIIIPSRNPFFLELISLPSLLAFCVPAQLHQRAKFHKTKSWAWEAIELSK